MSDPKVRRWAGIAGIIAGVLLVVAFPLYYAILRTYVLKRRDVDKIAAGNLSLADRVDLALEYELNKRIRGLGTGLYRLTGGRITRPYNVEVMILTTRGRRSGKEREVLLRFFRDGAHMIVAAANSGRSTHPDWFYNLKANPVARVQVMGRTLQVRAEELSPGEAAALWRHIVQVAPGYARYQTRTTRDIPLLRLIPIETAAGTTRAASA
jgi:deazaflavin-dependent oxidoreductase (nitroreductase family)